VFSDYQPISSTQFFPVYTWDRSASALELMFSSIEPYPPSRVYYSGSLFPTLCTVITYLYLPLFCSGQFKISLYVFSDYQPISSAQSSPVYAWDRSRSSLAIQLSCGTPANISQPTHHVPLIFLPRPLSDIEHFFCRRQVYICSTCDVIPGIPIHVVKSRTIFVIPP